MTTQPEALRLADKMNSYSLRSGYAWHCHKAAAELRRLHESNLELVAALKAAKTIIGHPDDSTSKYIASVINKAEGEAK
jgi:hypothetical protein